MLVKNKKRIARIISNIIAGILCILLIPLLIFNVTLIIKSFMYPEEVPNFAGYMPIIVLSGSMEPEFYTGDLVIAHKVDPSTLKEGDVITFHEGSSLITHRIKEISVEEEKRYYTTKGDNNNVEDRTRVTDAQIEGIYKHRIANLGNTALFLQTPVGMLVFIGLPLAIFILYDVFRRRYYEKREKKRTKELEEELSSMKQKLENSKDA
jgi:signal peptidase